MTLLAIDLPVPPSTSREELFGFVNEHLGEYLAFLISFAVIALGWRGHHRLYRYVTDVTARLRSVNTYWLLMIVLTPVRHPGALRRRGHRPTPTSPTGSASTHWSRPLAAWLMLLAGPHHRAGGAAARGRAAGLLPVSNARNTAVALTFLASIPVAFVIGPVGVRHVGSARA